MHTSGTLQPGQTVRFTDDGPVVFGKTTIEEIKEKRRQEKEKAAAKKKLPKNYKPTNH
jgi:hypothetical protein